MNHLLTCRRLGNRFFAMRHGESTANRQALINSHPDLGTTGFGLSATGRAQVRKSIASASPLDTGTLIYTSDFKRAVESAAIVHRVLRCRAAMSLQRALRERFFGDLDLADHRFYEHVWAADKIDAGHRCYNVEPATAVMARATALVWRLEKIHKARTILLVAHGDVLQILQTAFLKQDATQHRSLAPLQTAEIRELQLSND